MCVCGEGNAGIARIEGRQMGLRIGLAKMVAFCATACHGMPNVNKQISFYHTVAFYC